MTPQLRAAVIREGVVDGVLVLRDLDLWTSVTNDAEAVVRWALELPGWDRAWPIVYRDTQGRYDALLHHRGAFSGFRSLAGARSPEEAVRRLRGEERGTP